MTDLIKEKNLVLRQLDALIVTMTKAVQADVKLEMESWITSAPANSEYHPAKNTEHFCDAAACICGYQVLSGDLSAFPSAEYSTRDSYYQQGFMGTLNHDSILLRVLESISSDISRDMRKATKALLGTSHLAESIYLPECDERRYAANESKLFTSKELDELIHMREEHPSAAEALDYIKLCREKVVDYCKLEDK